MWGVKVVNIKDVMWLAGLLEGEGCFGITDSPRITVNMIDLDIIERVRKILGTSDKMLEKHMEKYNKNANTQYQTSIHGTRAISWMMTIYSLMGIRRQSKIREVISKWKEMKGHHTEKAITQAGRASAWAAAIKNLMRFKNITREQAIELLNSSIAQAKENG
jgi:hypothetical protein